MRQLIGLFLCLLIVGSHAQSLFRNVENNKNIIADIKDKNSEFYQMLEEGSSYVVDEVLDLLKNLEDAAKADLADLIKAWQVEKELLQGILNKATNVYNERVQICNGLEAQQHHLEREIRLRQEETQSNLKQIATNTAEINKLKNARCASNEIYVNHLIAHRDAMLLFKLLIKAIESYKAGSFVQVENVNTAVQSLKDFVNHYGKQHAEEFNKVLLQLESSINARSKSAHVKYRILNTKLPVRGKRVADLKVQNYAANKQYQKKEVVERDTLSLTGHIDNKNGQIKIEGLTQNTVRALADVKGVLLKLLSVLVANEKRDRDQDELNEANANLSWSLIKSRLQDESRKLARRNEKLARQITGLKVKLAKKISEVKACRKIEQVVLAAKQKCQSNLDAAAERFRARKVVLQGEIELFHMLYVYYKERVYQVATKADKERVQDYVNHHNLQRTQRVRKAAAFNGLNIKKYAEQAAAAQAKQQQRFLIA